MTLNASLFHEPWWLAAVTGSRFEEATVERGNHLVGRFPFVAGSRGPFKVSLMPAFTHLLGPIVDSGVGKPQTRLARRLSIARELIDQLPSFAFFKQVLDPSMDDGLAVADGLAFQDRGFQVTLQYTFQIDCRGSVSNTWESMNTTVRQHIRRAEEKYEVVSARDPTHFVSFYLKNLEKQNKTNRTDFAQFEALFAECEARKTGQILSAVGRDNQSVAMSFMVWGHGIMYYLLSTRAGDVTDNGSVSLLLWSAIRYAHEMQLKFDLDGVYSSGTARFFSGFGGRIGTRLIVSRAQHGYGLLRTMRNTFRPDKNEHFA